ncbi:MAG: DUF21 domain-containing protein [Planctomycetes bacterium]|nr:DUF21 domain-containing protein [Planctomycetota bacterium]
MLELLVALALFAVGLRLSAFFSGSETGFYRASFIRVSIDANAGDRVAQRLLWFARHPAYFVATCLVGNNVANYLTTVAVGLAAVALVPMQSDWVEIAGAMLMAPVVFIFGELLPKNLYYRAPLYHLRREVRIFSGFYRLFLVVSFPLIGISKLLERIAGSAERPLQTLRGRSRLAQLLSRGRAAGLLTEVQSRLVHGLLYTAAEPVSAAMTPASRVLGMADDASRAELLDYARRYGTAAVMLRRAGTEDEWYAYVRVADLAVTQRPLRALVRTMPTIDPRGSKLEALLALREAGATHGVVASGDVARGVVSDRGLVEGLFRSSAALAGRPPYVVPAGR